MGKTKRKSLSNNIRFEVFKRDSFKCQYCGKSAPEVTLEVDHIIPVSKGGNNDLINLITSCRECNSGKTNRSLDDNSVLIKQRNQLEEINERREQIKMMAQWRQELENLKEQQVDIIDEILHSRVQHRFNARGREDVKKVLGQHEFNFICDCLNIAFDTYLKLNDSNERFTEESIGLAVRKWPSICKYKAQEDANPDLGELRHIVNWFCKKTDTQKRYVFDVVKNSYEAGISIEYIWHVARNSRNFYTFENTLNRNIENATPPVYQH